MDAEQRGWVDFNPHSREGSDADNPANTSMKLHFNPHSREGSDIWVLDGWSYRPISIHTPAKGVTEIWHGCSRWKRISIHTPAKGVTRGLSTMYRARTNFNPHSREGSDFYTWGKWKALRISIHTPAKGVTMSSNFYRITNIFQSTLPRREWLRNLEVKCLLLQFQSTLPRREWQQFCLILGFIFFNITQFYQYHSLFLIIFL